MLSVMVPQLRRMAEVDVHFETFTRFLGRKATEKAAKAAVKPGGAASPKGAEEAGSAGFSGNVVGIDAREV